MRVGGQRHAPAALTPGKTRYPLYKRLGGPQSLSGRVRKISPPQGFDPRTVQPEDKIQMWAQISAVVNTGSGARPALCTMGTGPFSQK
jgi:hypothetical protein